MNPRAALTTYSLSRGAPSASLGTSPNCPRVVILPDNSLHTFVFFIRLFRCFLIEKPCALYRISKLFVKCFLSFFQNFFINLTSGESGIRTHAPLRTNGFQDRLVMTTSISLHIMFFNIFCAVLSAHVVFYHQISYLSITNLIFFSKNWTYSFNFRYMPIFTGIFPLFYSLFSLKNASAMTRSSGVVILILR